MNYTQQQLREFYKKSDKKTRLIVGSTEYISIVNAIAVSYNLTDTQKSDMGELIDLILMNVENRNDLSKEMEEKVSVDAGTAIKIASDIENKILNQIDSIYKEVIENAGGAEEDEEDTVDETPLNESDNLELLQSIHEALRNKKEMPEYVKNLSKETQTFISSNIWEKRVEEIGKKYSLDTTQLQDLGNIILSHILNLDSGENLSESLVNTLHISRLLAIQIDTEINERIFKHVSDSEYVPSTPLEKKSTSAPASPEPSFEKSGNISVPRYAPTPTPTPSTPTFIPPALAVTSTPIAKDLQHSLQDEVNALVPGYVPDNLPGVAIGESTAMNRERSIGTSQETMEKLTTQENKKEFIQRPISVPRFTLHSPDELADISGDPGLEQALNSERNVPVIQTGPIQKTEQVEQKTDTAVKINPKETPEKKLPPAESRPSAYTVDPYREAI